MVSILCGGREGKSRATIVLTGGWCREQASSTVGSFGVRSVSWRQAREIPRSRFGLGNFFAGRRPSGILKNCRARMMERGVRGPSSPAPSPRTPRSAPRCPIPPPLEHRGHDTASIPSSGPCSSCSPSARRPRPNRSIMSVTSSRSSPKTATTATPARTKRGGLRVDTAKAMLARAARPARPYVPGKPDESLLIKAVTAARASSRCRRRRPCPRNRSPSSRRGSSREPRRRPMRSPRSRRAITGPFRHRNAPRSRPSRIPPGYAIRSTVSSWRSWRRRASRPSPEADRVTLIRRLYLDLLGLPPTPQQVDAFVADSRPDAYERLVDRCWPVRIMANAARHWLDLARYADSNGFTIDSARSIWRYRDWVIDALNQDMPFDQFTIEQMAGDLLPNATLEQKIATGFHRNTLINRGRRHRRRAVPRRVHGGSRQHDRVGLARPDRRLLPVPRSQVRSAQPSASITSFSRSSTAATSRPWRCLTRSS